MSNKQSTNTMRSCLMILAFIGALWLLLAQANPENTVSAQPRISDTPVSIVIPTIALGATELVLATPTATMTPTEIGPVLLQAIAAPGDINVRDAPDPAGTRLGSLDPERQYPVRGRFIRWFQFDYEASETGTAWVYGDLVRIIGSEAEIPNVDPFAIPTAAPQDDPVTQTAIAIALTPGAAETATAEARQIAVQPESDSELGRFPATFTPPADIVARLPTNTPLISETENPPNDSTLAESPSSVVNTRIPPIVPIILLVGFGSIGLLISLVRGRRN